MSRRSGGTTVLQLCCLAATLLWPIDAEAQRLLRGRVAEDGSPITVAQADVIVTDSIGRAVGYALTDDTGHFQMLHPGPGTYELQVDRIGYIPVFAAVTLRDAVVAEIDIAMSILPVTLGHLDVIVRRQHEARTLGLAGIQARMRRGLGDFIQKQEIQRRGVSLTSDVLAGKSGVRFVSRNGLETDVRFLGSERFNGADCPPSIWVDGMLLRPPRLSDFTLDDVAPVPEIIETIEVYRRPSGVPVQYNTDAMCGVILIWTRR